MDTGADCRKHAAGFLVQAKGEPEREAHLIGMSEIWHRLAVQADQIETLAMKGKSGGATICGLYESADHLLTRRATRNRERMSEVIGFVGAQGGSCG
jgi:hypothetical protein